MFNTTTVLNEYLYNSNTETVLKEYVHWLSDFHHYYHMYRAVKIIYYAAIFAYACVI